jgi:hypothetical protein
MNMVGPFKALVFRLHIIIPMNWCRNNWWRQVGNRFEIKTYESTTANINKVVNVTDVFFFGLLNETGLPQKFQNIFITLKQLQNSCDVRVILFFCNLL